MKKHLAAIASAITLICAPVLVQAAPAADSATVEATKQMLDAMKVREMMVQSLRQLEQIMPQQLSASVAQMIQADTKMTAAQKKEALEKFEKRLPATTAQMHALFSDATLVDDMVAEMVPLYANTYTVDEIRQLSAFYQSPLGQKMLASTPKLMAQSMEINNRVMMPRIQKLMSQTVNEATGK
jgi:hypothetical protein